LPKGFQSAEMVLEHGLIDMVVPRRELRDTLARLLHVLVRGASVREARERAGAA
jgi:acetyl-CoA carboxylase carboxyl transferase subunit beta